jgi:hypothetical protein
MMFRRLIVVLLVSITASACADGDDDGATIAPPPSVTAERTFGSINHVGNGIATVTSDYVLQSISCDAGKLTMITAAGTFVGTMDCAAQVTQETIDRFVGKPVLIVVTDTRLKIEHPDAGSLDYPATDVVVQP